jgi:replicative DNA helicase
MTPQPRTFAEVLTSYERERRSPEREPIRLGWPSIDAELRGIAPGQVLGIAGRTATGKTWVLASLSANLAVRPGIGALICSLEQTAEEWTERQAGIFAQVAPATIEGWAKAGELEHRVSGFAEKFSNVLILDATTSMAELPEALQAARDRLSVPLRVVLVDYAGLVSTQGKDAYERASRLALGLKALAKSERIAIVAAMQLSRAGGDGSEPVSRSMLRDSGVLEESVDALLGIWRPGKAAGLDPAETANLENVLRCSVLKNRRGRDGATVDLMFNAESRRVYEPEPDRG